MEYTGLIHKYKVNRPLTYEEKAQHYHQKNRLDVVPLYSWSIIKYNSTYLESVDKFYAWRGFLTLIMGAIAGGMLFFLVSNSYALFNVVATDKPEENMLGAVVYFSIVFTGLPALLIAGIWGLNKESFRYTHYPIRLNRKIRMVYVFRLDGSVLAASWDKIYFTLGRGKRPYGVQDWDIRGHVLADDKETVLETFSFAMNHIGHEELNRHWEYLRRYMEEGPQAIEEFTPALWGIDARRETFTEGFLCLSFFGVVFAGAVFMSLFNIPISIGRWLAMRSCKIPQWPAEVEAACAIAPNDPHAQDGRSKPMSWSAARSGYWMLWYQNDPKYKKPE